MAEASATRKPSTPRSRNDGSSGAMASSPILQVPQGWWAVMVTRRI